MTLALTDTILAVYAERASGPGWHNNPVWVVVRSQGGDLREECIQPDHHTTVMSRLFNISAEVNREMCAEAQLVLGGKRSV